MNRTAASVLLVLAFATRATADLTNPCTLTLKETSPSRFSVEFTLPIIQGRVLKARPLLPDVCVMEGDADVQGDGSKVVRTWAMTCDPHDLVGTAIGVEGLLGTSLEVQLTIETLDGRNYVGQLCPTQAYYVVPPSPTMRSLAVDVGEAMVRQVLRHLELAVLLLLCAFSGVRLRARFASAAAFAISLALGQWLMSKNWIDVSAFLPVMLTAAMGLVIALSILRGKTPLHAGRGTLPTLMALVGVLYGSSGLPVQMVLSQSEQYLAICASALGTMAGMTLVILCADQLHAAVVSCGQDTRERLRFWITYLGGVVVCAIGLYQGIAPLFTGSVKPTMPAAALLAAIALGLWCGTQPRPVRFVLPSLAGCALILGMVLSLRGVSLPQTTLVVYGSLALVGLLLVWPVRRPGWAALVLVAVSSLYHGFHAAGVLRESVALPVAQATALMALVAFLFLVTYSHAEQQRLGTVVVRLCGLSIAVLAVSWRLVEYRQWVGEELAADATMGFVRLPALLILLLLAALVLWPRKRRFRPATAEKGVPLHWGLVLLALLTVSVAGVRVRNPFHAARAPTAAEAKPIVAMLLTDTYQAFNLADEDAAFDQLARNLSEDLVPVVYLDSRRRLTAGTRQGAEVTVKDVRVMSVEAPIAAASSDGTLTYPCKWVVTARVRHWQHIHDRQNIYLGTLAIRVENDRWKISDLELLSEEREIVSGAES